MFQWLRDLVASFFTLVRDLLVYPLLELWQWVRDFTSEVIIPWVVGNLPFEEIIGVALTADTIADVAEIVQEITWIFPFWQLLGIYAAAWWAAAAIRAARWVVRMIPILGIG